MRVATIVAALVVAGTGTAAADQALAETATAGASTRAEAERYAAQAKVSFDARDYRGAIAGYGEAYRRYRSPGLLFNLGQAYRLDGDCAAATLMYHQYLREAPRSPYRAIVEQHLDALASCTYEQTFRASSVPRAEGHPLLLGMDRVPVPASHPGRGRRLAGLASAGAGVVLVAAGSYFMADASHAADEVSEGYRNGGNWDDVAAADARGQRSEVIGAVLLGAGGTAIVGGATLYLLGRRADRAEASVAVMPSAGGATARVSWRF